MPLPPIPPSPSPIQPNPAPSGPGYTQVTMGQALVMLSARLGDPQNTYWSLPEVRNFVIEALRTWQALTSFYRQNVTIPYQAGIPWVDLAQAQVTGFTPTVTDAQLASEILYALLEKQMVGGMYTGTDQFSLKVVQDAIQNRINRFLSDSGAVVSLVYEGLAAYAQGSSQFTLSPDAIDVRRVAWTLAPPMIATGLSGDLASGPNPMTLYGLDTVNHNQLTAFQATYSLRDRNYYTEPWPTGLTAEDDLTLTSPNSSLTAPIRFKYALTGQGGYPNGYYLFYPPVVLSANSTVYVAETSNTFPQTTNNSAINLTTYQTGGFTFGIPLNPANISVPPSPYPNVPVSGSGGVFATASIANILGIIFRLQVTDGQYKYLYPLTPGMHLQLSFQIIGNPSTFYVTYDGTNPAPYASGLGPNAYLFYTSSFTANPGDMFVSFNILSYSNPHDAQDANNRTFLLDILPFNLFG